MQSIQLDLALPGSPLAVVPAARVASKGRLSALPPSSSRLPSQVERQYLARELTTMHWSRVALLLCLAAVAAPALAADGNRLTYLDESDPYYVHRSFPKLVTPQW